MKRRHPARAARSGGPAAAVRGARGAATSGAGGGATSGGVAVARGPWTERLAAVPLWLLVVVTPLYFAPTAKDPFRLPKLMLAEWLAIASLLPLAWALRRVETVRWQDLWRQPAIRALLPLVLVATAGLATTSHPLHVREGLADLCIGAACLAGWSMALPAGRLERLLGALLWPAVALAAIGIAQFLGLHPLPVAAALGGARYSITATAGNAGDLAAFLVLPCLIAQWRLARGGSGGAAAAASGAPGAAATGADRAAGDRTGRRGGLAWPAAALALSACAMALTQTFAALAALLAGSLVFWALALRPGAAGRRRLWLALAALAVVAVGVVAAVPGLRSRAMVKASQARQGDWNAVLTGRLDGWRAALWMLGEHPWAGVGQGAYRAEFAPAKLALLGRGVAFHSGQQQNFANAHDEPLEVAADLGFPGLLALGWALAVMVPAARARRPVAASRRAPAAGPGASGKSGAVTGDPAVAMPGAEASPGAAAPAGAGLAPRQERAAGAFAAAGLVALSVLCLVDFPLRVALVAFPALLFVAWVLRPAAAAAAA